MTISELQKKAAEVLGVSSSQKELAFDILISKISEVLVDNVTLKVPLIGFFQIKENDESNSLIFSPLSEDFSKESKTLYLTIESPKKFPSSQETDSGAFSIGVGKPLIPLTDSADTNSEPETSFAILKKSIEERVNEILSESDHLPYFNIWDDYYESLNNQAEGKNEQVNLSELTADIEFKDDLIAENITNNLLSLETKEEEGKEVLPEASVELTPSDLLEDYVPHKINEEPPVTEEKPDEAEANKTEFEQLEQLIEKIESLEKKLPAESDAEKNTEPPSPFDDRFLEEKLAEEDLDKKLAAELKEEKIPEDLEVEEEEEFLGLKKKKDGKIEWNWGDELKEEFGPALEDETIYDALQEEEEEEIVSPEDIFKKTKPLSVTLFEQLDESIKKEFVETEKEVQYLEYGSAPQSFDFVEDKAAEIPPADYPEERRTVYQTPARTDTFEEEYHSKEKYFNKTFLIIFFAFIIISGLTIYLLLPNKGDTGKQNVTILESDTAQQQEISSASPTPADTQTAGSDEFSDFPRVASLPVKDEGKKEEAKNLIPPAKTNIVTTSKTKPENDLYKILQTDTRIYKTIYYDGSRYNVQVSSWRNKQKAENEVKRLRREGLTAFLVEANLPQKGGLWYRVRIGNFNSREEAEQFLINYNFEK